MEHFIQEDTQFFLCTEKTGIARQLMRRNKRAVTPLVIQWTHHCKATRTGRRLSGGHQILSSSTQALLRLKSGEIIWQAIDDRTGLTGGIDNFGDRQQVGEFDYQEVRIFFEALKPLIATQGGDRFALAGGFVLTATHLTYKGVDALAKELRKDATAKRVRELIEGREIYIDIRGWRRVNIGDKSYPVEVPTGEKTHDTCGDYYGSYASDDPVLHAWLLAAKEVGVPARYSWHGVMSALGDHASVAPPWKPREKNYQRNWEVSPCKE